MTYEYNDGLHPAGRRPRLYLAKGAEVVKFTGENIPEYCAVQTAQYEKNGKWSNTQYTLLLANGVRPLHFLSPMHGVWGDNIGSWGEVVEKLGLPIEVTQELVRREYPDTAKRLDALEAFAAEQSDEIEVVVVSFGSPTNRMRADGYWSAPKSATTADGRTVTVEPGLPDQAQMQAEAEAWSRDWGAPVEKFYRLRGEETPSWSHPRVVEPAGARVIGVRHSPGMHGGYYAVEVAVPAASAGESEGEGTLARKLREALTHTRR